MKGPTRSPKIRRLTAAAQRLGYAVRFVPYCEDSKTPGALLGLRAGVCDYGRREIKVSTTGHSKAKLEAILEHELEHAELGPGSVAKDCPAHGLRCGNRPTNGS